MCFQDIFMRLNVISIILLAVAAFTAGCADDELSYPGRDGEGLTGTSPLRFEVKAFSAATGGSSRAAEPSAIPEPESEDEKKIENFWLFQFNPDGSRLAVPKYYSIPENGATLDDLTTKAYNDLTPDASMILYVVTNTGDSGWGNSFSSLEEVKAAKLPSPYPIRILSDKTRTDKLLIPMSGESDVVTKTGSGLITVPVTRIYAKVKIRANFNLEGMRIYDVSVDSIPWYGRVAPVEGSDADETPAAEIPLPANTPLLSRAYNSTDAVTDSDGDKWLVIYVPENIRGEVAGADKKTATDKIPTKALSVNIRSKYNGMEYDFRVYPGENDTNNFNVRRNRVYRVTVNVKNAVDQHRPSSNCYIVKPNDMVVFEPYNRAETGGGYNISDYLNPNDEDLRIASTEIIWQTKDCVGDNTDGDKVTFTLDKNNPIHSKITVRTGAEGNALVGARNSKGDIIWSWHIWVTNNEPDNLREAIVYKTYAWDERKIYGKDSGTPRIPGYGVMPCNLGALAYRVEGNVNIRENTTFPDAQIRTFGMLYQWGRKDPFPPLTRLTEDIYTPDSWLEYNDENTRYYYNGQFSFHYGNDNSTNVGKTSAYDTSKLFHSITKSNVGTEEVKYSIAHPTVYIAGTSTLDNPGTSYNQDPKDAYYTDEGNWCPHEKYDGDCLWGGSKPNNSQKKYCVEKKRVGGTFWNPVYEYIYIYDNYGTEKSIFDPCPNGWRVAPPDLWLGFTDTGLNPETDSPRDMSHINYNSDEPTSYGMSLHMREWQDGPTSYFPTQGTITVNGRGYHVGYCGNYHNATCSDNQRVNILHIHDNSKLSGLVVWSGGHFHIFETEFINKSGRAL